MAFPRVSAALVFVSLFSLTLHAQTRREGIVYTTDAEGPHAGDLYEPQGDGPFPAMVFLHGGSWRSGHRGEFKPMGTDLAQHGVVGFSVDYDLKAGSFPLSWEEARAAVQFVRDHAAEYHVDPNRVVIAGTSAGGELAALVALAPEGPASSKQDEVKVSGAVILNGVYDLCFPAGVIKRYMGGDCASHKDAFTDASPLRHVSAGGVPFFVGHGTSDHVVPYRAAEQFVAALQKSNVPVTPFVAQGGGHMYWLKKKFYAANLKAVEGFLDSTVGQGSR